jgi:FkbM family methyltransferase
MKLPILLGVSRKLSKLAHGRAHSRAPATDLANALAALGYLVGRKLGAGTDARLRLGYGGKRHEWVLRRREDLTVLEEVFLDEDYDIAIPPPAVVFDLGANIGAASIYFALRWPNALVFAVEPSPEMHARLRETTAGYRNIRCLAYAAGATDGVMPFTMSSSSVGGSFYRNEEGAHVVEMPVRSLASLMAECGVDRIGLLKFDIEGAEGLLFQEPAILERIDAFVGEIHPDLMTEPVETFLARFSAFATERQELSRGRFLLRGQRLST